MKRLLTVCAVACTAYCVVLIGCASTSIETPIGTYTSSRDSELDELYIEISKSPDGTETTIVQVNGAKGSASSVIDSQTELLRVLIEAAFSAGLKAAPGG